MSFSLFTASLLLSVSTAPYAESVRSALEIGAKKWVQPQKADLRPLLKKPRVVLLEVEVDPSGFTRQLRLVVNSEVNKLDDRGRAFVLWAEPLAPPPATENQSEGRNATVCVLRLTFARQGRSVQIVPDVACFESDGPVPTVARSKGKIGGDAGDKLFGGWAMEAKGDIDGALPWYRAAVNLVPSWGLAARALGLALVKSKRVTEAIPHLSVYVKAYGGASDVPSLRREIARFEQRRAAILAEASRVRERLSKQDLGLGIKKGYPLLEPCLRTARQTRALALGLDTLVLTWTIRMDGTVHAARLEGPKKLLMTEHAECLERAVGTWQFPQYSKGSEVTARRVPIQVRGSKPAPKPEEVAASGTPPLTETTGPILEEPSFSQCERTGGEIGVYVKRRFARLARCMEAERLRNPKSGFPQSLPITFVIDATGPVRSVGVGHRFFRQGPVAECVKKALAGSLQPRGGADCPAEFSLDLRALQPGL